MRRAIAAFMIFAFVMTSAVQAAPGKGKGAEKTSTVNGSFVGFQENKHVKKIVVMTSNDGKNQEQSYKMDDSTKITLDGQTVAATALHAGLKLTITLTKKVATQIEAVSN